MKIIISIFSLIGLALNIYLAYTYLKLWTHPQVNDIEIIYSLSVLVFFEFILVHSGVFMSYLGRSWKSWLLIIFFYGVFALAFNAMVSDNQILILYCAVVLNRMLPKIFNREKPDMKEELSISAIYAVVYFALIMIMIFASDLIPQFGLTKEFLEAARFDDIVKGEGFMDDMPHAIMCFGVVYYVILALFDIFYIKGKF